MQVPLPTCKIGFKVFKCFIFSSLKVLISNSGLAINLTFTGLSSNFELRGFGVRFNIFRSTAYYFQKWIAIIHGRLFDELLCVPFKEEIMKTMPMCFR